jgi:outer membrane biosynthesis protein TonB
MGSTLMTSQDEIDVNEDLVSSDSLMQKFCNELDEEIENSDANSNKSSHDSPTVSAKQAVNPKKHKKAKKSGSSKKTKNAHTVNTSKKLITKPTSEGASKKPKSKNKAEKVKKTARVKKVKPPRRPYKSFEDDRLVKGYKAAKLKYETLQQREQKQRVRFERFCFEMSTREHLAAHLDKPGELISESGAVANKTELKAQEQ